MFTMIGSRIINLARSEHYLTTTVEVSLQPSTWNGFRWLNCRSRTGYARKSMITTGKADLVQIVSDARTPRGKKRLDEGG